MSIECANTFHVCTGSGRPSWRGYELGCAAAEWQACPHDKVAGRWGDQTGELVRSVNSANQFLPKSARAALTPG